MKRFIPTVILLFLMSNYGLAQNLVADPGFEDWDGTYGQNPMTLSALATWYTANGTADYHHVDTPGSNLTGLEPCPVGEGNTWCGVPYEGEGVLGCWKGNGPDGSKEWGGTQLLEPLVPGDCYEISFWINNKEDEPGNLYETNQWGVFFSHTQYPTFNANLTNFNTMADHWVTCEQVISGSEWQQVTFSYTASEAFEYVYIGYIGNVSESTFTVANDAFLLGFYVWIDELIIEHVDVDVSEDVAICETESTLLTFTSNYPFVWTDGITSDTTSSVWVSPTETTTYYVEATGTYDCIKLDSIVVTVIPDVVVDYPSPICVASDPVMLDPAAGNGVWDGPGITNSASGLFDPNAAGSGQFNISFTSSDNCDEDFIMVVVVDEIPEVEVEVDQFEGCYPLETTFTNISADPGISHTWSIEGNSSNDFGQFNYTFGNAGIYDLELTVEHYANCSSTHTFESLVSVYDPPSASFSYTPEMPDLVNNEVTFEDTSNGNIFAWEWNFGDNTSSFQNTPTHKYGAPGIYEVDLVVTGQGDCTDSISQFVVVENAVRLFVPNVISANADGINDWFEIGYIGELYDFEVMIFDRWGAQLFQSNDPSFQWKGTNHAGQILPQGNYPYVITYTLLPATATGEAVNKVESGDVLILR